MVAWHSWAAAAAIKIYDSSAVTVSGGTFDINSRNETVGAVTLNSGSIIGTTGTLTGSSYATTSGTISAILGGAVTLTQSGAGTTTLSGANTYSGATTVSSGTLNVTSATALGTGTATVNSPGTLAVNASTAADITYANSVAGAGKVQFLYSATGSHDIFLNNLGSFTGTIELSLGSGQATPAARLGLRARL